MSRPNDAPNFRIFISYSQKDKARLNEFKTHLAPLLSEYPIDAWDDSRIAPGDSWRDQIEAALSAAGVGVLLVSPAFLGSRFVREVEMPALLESARNRGLILFVVHVRTSVVSHVPALSSIQAANDPARPISRLSGDQRDAAWAAVVDKLVAAIKRKRDAVVKPREALTIYREFSQRLLLFALKAADLKTNFELSAESAFLSDRGAEDIAGAIVAYNAIAEELITQGAQRAHELGSLLPSELYAELQDVVAFALGGIHRSQVFQLNEAKTAMNRVRRGELAENEAGELRERTLRDIQPLLRGLNDKIPVLERRVQRLYDRIAEL